MFCSRTNFKSGHHISPSRKWEIQISRSFNSPDPHPPPGKYCELPCTLPHLCYKLNIYYLYVYSAAQLLYYMLYILPPCSLCSDILLADNSYIAISRLNLHNLHKLLHNIINTFIICIINCQLLNKYHKKVISLQLYLCYFYKIFTGVFHRFFYMNFSWIMNISPL